MFKKLAIAACLSSSALAFGSAQGAVLACPTSINTLVTGAAQCQYSTTANQDFLNTTPLTVNAEGFFGATATTNLWQFDSKLTENGGQSGVWNITSIIEPNWDDVMLIFKSGNDTTLVGYLLTDGILSGTYQSPFRNPPFTGLNANQILNVSHISVYYRIGPSEGPTVKVPEPATLGLLGLGLVGLAMVRRRKS